MSYKNFKVVPSAYIMDNRFFYGEYEIIGNAPLPEDSVQIDYPIMYGQSISAVDRNKICFCRGRFYQEIPLDNCQLPEKDFRNNGISYSLNVSKPLVEEYIAASSNEPFWVQQLKISFRDLRNPAYSKELAFVLKQIRVRSACHRASGGPLSEVHKVRSNCLSKNITVKKQHILSPRSNTKPSALL